MPNTIRSGGPGPVAVPTTPAEVPVQPAAPRGAPTAAPAPARDGFVAGAGAAAGAVVARAAAAAGPSAFELIPGRVPGAVSLPDVLRQLAGSPQGAAMVAQVIGQMEAKLGVTVPPEVKAAALENPVALTRAFEVSPEAMAAGLAAVNAAYKAGKIPQVAPRVLHLPQKFDFDTLSDIAIEGPKADLKELAPGLFTGDLPGTLSADQVKRNTVVAEVFQRLSDNASAGPGQKFEVTYLGKRYERLDTFIQALRANGYEVSVGFEQRIANFAALKVQVPGSDPPTYLDVPAPLMVKTGVVDALGNEAVVPAAHSEMVISLRAGPNSKGPLLDADVKFYQGTAGTGFFPANVTASPEWCGKVQHGTLTGDRALQAIKLAGLFSDVVGASARALDLYADGYGLTGVCNDSVAVIQFALLGTADPYPLLMNDALLLGEVERRLSDGVRRDDPAYRELAKAIKALPSDTRANPSAIRRALASIPWLRGFEPFLSTVQARAILEG